MSSNTDLWDKFEATNPNYTNTFKGKGGFQGTAINACYVMKRLTERFGPCGKGWKFIISSERIEEGHTLSSGDKCKLHIVIGRISYVLDGQWYDTSEQAGQTFLVGENSYGPFTDEEAPKKSITDCLTKCAVSLGIGADVHLGLYDDNKYVNDLYERFRTDEGSPRIEPAAPNQPPAPVAPQAKQAASNLKAKKFAEETLAELKTGFSEYSVFRDWHNVRLGKIAQLKAYEPTMHADIIKLIAQHEEKFKPIIEGLKS